MTPPICKQHSGSSESLFRNTAKQPNESAKDKLCPGLPSSLVDVMDVDANENNNNNSFDGVRLTMKRSSAPFRLNEKTESARINTNVDDDVQEVLRIMRGNVQNDINHESPNRTEREILVQNAVNEMRVFSTHRGSSVRMEKRNAELMASDVEPSDYPSFASITESGYQFLTDALNKKLSICLKDLHHYGISSYNDLPEINNNLEEFAMYAHEGYLVEPWMQALGSQYIAELKTNDIEATVNLE
ncbi:hypothetical protein X777_03461 [Ooceraea biroi]|nr:hypothetical protein X777_03461 [Ooceraea biroi]